MLDPTLTSPYDFYQYWLNDDDLLVIQHLRWLTLMTAEEVAAVEGAQIASPGDRPAPEGAGLRPDGAHPWSRGGRSTGQGRRIGVLGRADH